MSRRIEDIVRKLDLKSHPEGGYYNETYRSNEIIPESVLGHPFEGDRNCSTAIYFLLTAENFSAFHRIHQDEMWHFYQGSPLLLHTISPEGEYECIEIGADIMDGQHPQYVVPAGVWFASEVKEANDYSLVGCTVSPGFDFRDFELAAREDLIKSYPQHSEVITSLTRVG